MFVVHERTREVYRWMVECIRCLYVHYWGNLNQRAYYEIRNRDNFKLFSYYVLVFKS